MQEKIEILSVSLLEQYHPLVSELRYLSASLGIEFGWHYLLDLTWMLGQMELGSGIRVMDAGAGTGIMQWFLARKGVEVFSVDRLDRAYLPLRYRLLFNVQGLRKGDLKPMVRSIWTQDDHERKPLQKMAVNLRDVLRAGLVSRAAGSVLIYNQDLGDMPEIPDSYLDYVVAVSSLEHNSPQNLKLVLEELIRVLKPGGCLLATLGAARDQDWFHKPSRGWCYSESTLRQVFGLAPKVPSNYESYDDLFDELRNCAELRGQLASFYRKSGDNGMPWGVWDPQYQPVGVCKIKKSVSVDEFVSLGEALS
ncbi:MAG TPA: methyltransferase domain-containing protein [Anaerolineales bacterium]|nr:methyltransferase domain-containing protein [Anaerolineales bacterium]